MEKEEVLDCLYRIKSDMQRQHVLSGMDKQYEDMHVNALDIAIKRIEKLTIDLKDCPFCGGDASLCINGYAVFVKCDNCGCKSHFIRIEHGGAEAITAVVNRWNERAFN